MHTSIHVKRTEIKLLFDVCSRQTQLKQRISCLTNITIPSFLRPLFYTVPLFPFGLLFSFFFYFCGLWNAKEWDQREDHFVSSRTPAFSKRNFCCAHVLHFCVHTHSHSHTFLHILFFPSVARDNWLPSKDFFMRRHLQPRPYFFFLLSRLIFYLFLCASSYVCALARTKRR